MVLRGSSPTGNYLAQMFKTSVFVFCLLAVVVKFVHENLSARMNVLHACGVGTTQKSGLTSSGTQSIANRQ